MRPLFTEIICPSVFATSDTAASAFIMEETADDESNDIPRSQQANAADDRLAEVEEYLQFLTCPQGLSNAEFCKFMQYSSGFFFSNSKLWRCDTHRKHKIVVLKEKRYELLKEVHDILGHKKIYAIRMQLLEQFWWLFLDQDVKWFVQTCHQCQVCQMRYHYIPLTVAAPTSLFHKTHIDTMYMPRVLGYRYIIQARCSLLSYPEHRKLRKENGSMIGMFIFEEILCHWGVLEEIITDHGLAFVEALNWLAEQYGIHHIRISPYNSQANGIVEHSHLDIREAIMKVCDREERKWPTAMHAIFWAEHITTHKALGHSAYYIAHGVEPLLPFDLAEATYMVPPQSAMSTTELIALRARQLQKRPEDLDTIWDHVIKACFTSIHLFKTKYANTICAYQFAPSDLILVRNSHVEASLDRKTKPRWIGPMVIVQQTTHGAYILTEMDGAVSKLRFAAFHIIPYHARWRMNIDLETLFVFPDANEETEDVEDEMEPDEDIRETAGLEEEVPSDEEEDHSP
jgi:hypothetical protein